MAKKKTATRRVLTIAGLLIGVLIVLGVVARATGLLGGGEEGISVETADAERRTITQVVTASGKVQPEVEVKISSDVSGEITHLGVKEGEKVQKGDLLARINPDVYQARREQAEADVLQMKANLRQAEADLLQAEQQLKRQEALYEKDAISKSEYETAQAQHQVAKAQRDAASYRLRSAQASLQQSAEQLNKTEIYAPMSGTVSMLSVEEGERVVGTQQMSGTEMMRIALLDQMEMVVDVNENDVVNVALEDTARLEVDAFPERSFEGAVTEIANSARMSGQGTQEQVTNFPVKVRIRRPQFGNAARSDTSGSASSQQEVPLPSPRLSRLRPGMSGTADIFTKTVFNAVAVPIQAVTVRDYNEVQPERDSVQADTSTSPQPASGERGEDLRKVVFVVKDGKARMHEVSTGIADDKYIQITDGLSGDETVITGPYRVVSRELRPGMSVNARDNNQPSDSGGEAQASL